MFVLQGLHKHSLNEAAFNASGDPQTVPQEESLLAEPRRSSLVIGFAARPARQALCLDLFGLLKTIVCLTLFKNFLLDNWFFHGAKCPQQFGG